jgi:hypothetical protein
MKELVLALLQWRRAHRGRVRLRAGTEKPVVAIGASSDPENRIRNI